MGLGEWADDIRLDVWKFIPANAKEGRFWRRRVSKSVTDSLCATVKIDLGCGWKGGCSIGGELFNDWPPWSLRGKLQIKTSWFRERERKYQKDVIERKMRWKFEVQKKWDTPSLQNIQ